MAATFKVISPVDGSVYVERPLPSDDEVQGALNKARGAQRDWKATPLIQRQMLMHKFVDAMVSHADEIATELTWQMGRAIRHSPNEIKGGFNERARYMIDVAEEALTDVRVGPKEGFRRFLRRDPLGTVFVIAPWNYPYLCSVNAVVPALVAGNSVILKMSAQTPLVAERYAQAAKEAGLPEGLLQYLHVNHDQVSRMIGDERVNFVAFTGSVDGGRSVHRAGAERFINMGLELGGKDPSYVRPDTNMAHAVDCLVDGSYFNAGQSCCGIKRIYVHKDVYDTFIEGFVALTYQYKLDNPLEQSTTIGPVVRAKAAADIRAQIQAAVAKGAKTLIDEKKFDKAKNGTPYMAPQALVNLDNSMDFVREETFGPAVGILKVSSDDEAIKLMNDNRYGLTASIFTSDLDAAERIGDQIDTGTWYMNRCDYLDPALGWVGVKDSGIGCTLSKVGYEYLTRPKSFHLRWKV
ncbi:MAG: aldehyde dehydrogenase family protein [Pseudomonadota bacterium]